MQRVALSGMALLAIACTTQNGKHPPESTHAGASADATARAHAFVEAYLARKLADTPELGRDLGLHEHDGKVAPIDAASIAARIAHRKQALAELAALPVDSFTDPLRLDLELIRLDAERTIFSLETLELHKRLLTHRDLFDVSSYLVRDYAPLADRVRALLDHVEAASAETERMLAVLHPNQPRTHLETARKIFGGMREYFEGDVATQAKPALERDPALRARYERVIPAGLAAVERVVRWIDDVAMKQATEDFALGEKRFLEMLRVNEGLEMSLAELDAMSKRDFQRNYDAFVAVAKKIDPKLSTKEVAMKVANDRLPANGVLEAARRQLNALLAFIEKGDIITIGANERATVEVTPPFQRWNSAFLDMAGPFEKAKASYYYISPPDPSWPKEMQEQYIPYEGDLLATSVHEVYPGHFVQALHANRAPTLAQKMLDSYAFVEGWAHYAEEMMLEAGFGKGDPRLELGQLSNALLRNCRFLAAIGLHTGGMTVDEAKKLFEEKCFIDPGNALQQAYRGTFDPGYLSYTLGKLQIIELRKEFFARRGTTSLREFHDWLLSFGSPPVELIRARL
jgi:hypothetical protein